MRGDIMVRHLRNMFGSKGLLFSFAISAVGAGLAGGVLVASVNPNRSDSAYAGGALIEVTPARPTTIDPNLDARLIGTPGYWRIAADADGTWWFLSPDGEREFLNTVTTVQPYQQGRNDKGPHYVSRDWSGGIEKDGDIAQWASATLQRVKDSGFKGLGAWSHPAFHDLDVPITRDLNIWTWMHGPAKRLYHPDFAKIAEMAVEHQVPQLAENRNLVGYYIDNELDWSDTSSGPTRYFDYLEPTDPNRQALMQVLRATWADVDAFNADWHTDLASLEDVDAWTALPRSEPAAYDKLLTAFRYKLACDYFQLTIDLIRKHDPNHLILGVRFKGWAPEEVVRAMRGRTDAVSLNYYVADARLDRELFEMLHRASEQPVIITEYSFHALDGRSGNRNTFGFSAQVMDQTARADGYRQMTEGLAAVPWVIGADWFQWNDEPPSGRKGDGEDVNFGIVDVDDVAYQHLIDTVREVSPRVNAVHGATDASAASSWRRSFDDDTAWRMPMLDKAPRIDGNLSDWSEANRLPGIRRGETVGLERSPYPEPEAYLGWTDAGLYVGLVVYDKDIHGAPLSGNWWTRDCVELFIRTRPVADATNDYSADDHQFFFVPTAFPGSDGAAGYTGQWNRAGDAIDATLSPHPLIVDAARVLPGKYVVEMFIPKKALNEFDPQSFPELGFNLHVTNFQSATTYFWSTPKEARTQYRPNTWGKLLLGR